MVNFLSPEVIVIGGGVTGALGDTFIERIWEIAQRYTLPGRGGRRPCVPAALGDDSGIVGCAAYAKATASTAAASGVEDHGRYASRAPMRVRHQTLRTGSVLAA